MKLCYKYKIEKDESEFYKDKSSDDGLYIYCKMCHSKYTKQYAKNNPEKIRKFIRRHKINNPDQRMIIITY